MGEDEVGPIPSSAIDMEASPSAIVPARQPVQLDYDSLATLLEERATFKAQAARSSTVLGLEKELERLRGELRVRDAWITWVSGQKRLLLALDAIAAVVLVIAGAAFKASGWWVFTGLLVLGLVLGLLGKLAGARTPKFGPSATRASWDQASNG